MSSEVTSIDVVKTEGGQVRLQAQLGRESFWYELPGGSLREDVIGDAVLLSTLPSAMLKGSQLTIPREFPVSQVLANNLPKMQRIINLWNARFQIIELQAEVRSEAPRDQSDDVGLFYAGGIDSSFELLSNADLVDTLVCVYGFDFDISPELLEESLGRIGAVAEHFKKNFVPVTTNHSDFLFATGVSRLFGHGLTLGAIGVLLGFKECRIASSYTVYGLGPWGSHPLFDPLYSNDLTHFVHGDNSISRFEKTKRVAEDDYLLENLRVCWDSHSDNCGHCSKCVRTMAALRILGKNGPFPHEASLSDYRKFAATTDVCWVTELVVAAREAGDFDLERSLSHGLRLHDLRESAKHMVYALFGGRLHRFIRNRRQTRLPAKWEMRPDLKI